MRCKWTGACKENRSRGHEGEGGGRGKGERRGRGNKYHTSLWRKYTATVPLPLFSCEKIAWDFQSAGPEGSSTKDAFEVIEDKPFQREAEEGSEGAIRRERARG